MLKNQKGITLVALVVTIVVLIILATISIAIVLDEEGIVQRARETENHQLNADAQWEATNANIVEYIDSVLDEDETPDPDPEDQTGA